MPDFPSRRDHLVAPGQKCAYQFPAEVLRGCKHAVLRAFAHVCDQGWQPAGSLQPGQSKRKALTWRAESPTTGGKWWFKRKSSFQRFCFLKGLDLLCWSKGCLALWGYHLNGSKTSFEKKPFSFEVNETQRGPVHAVPLLLLLFQSRWPECRQLHAGWYTMVFPSSQRNFLI